MIRPLMIRPLMIRPRKYRPFSFRKKVPNMICKNLNILPFFTPHAHDLPKQRFQINITERHIFCYCTQLELQTIYFAYFFVEKNLNKLYRKVYSVWQRFLKQVTKLPYYLRCIPNMQHSWLLYANNVRSSCL